MANRSHEKAALAKAALDLMPPIIRRTFLEDADFRKEYGLKTEVIISFDDHNVSVKRSTLFNAIRKILSGASTKVVIDKNGHKWKLKNISKEGELPQLALSCGKHQLVLPDVCIMSPDRSTRLHSLEAAVSDINLPNSSREAWSNVLSVRALEYDEIDVFNNEIRDTPVQRARAIRSQIVSGQSKISDLVPPSRKYFERLVGAYDGSVSIHDYASRTVKSFFEQLSVWKPYDGLLFSLLLSTHSALTAEIKIDQVGNEDLVRAFDFLDKHGDRISQLGAIEVGLRVLQSLPEIQPILMRLIRQIRDDDVDGHASGFKLLSALFILVDGELSRTRLFASEPPFYRRLTALSQAALIHRQIVNSRTDINSFCEWVFGNRGKRYFLQSFADMRMEPRWSPDLADAAQIKADFFGRIVIAAKNNEHNIKGSDLYDLILGDDSESLLSLCKFPRPFMAGPLEGTENRANVLPAEISEAIETQLRKGQLEPSSFIALVNSALIFSVGADQAELAAKTLKLGRYRLANVDDRTTLLTILHGLATVAAISRSYKLADELRILVRRYKRDAQYKLSIEEAMHICLVAASSRANLTDWRDFVGDCITELAFGDLEGNDGDMLYSYLLCLCHSVPELWVSCGRADAALKAYNIMRHLS